MKKIERRAVVCVFLALILAAGLGVFLVRYCLDGGSWASSAFNQHLYNTNGVLSSGTVLDQDGDVLSTMETASAPIMTMLPFARPPSMQWAICRAISVQVL